MAKLTAEHLKKIADDLTEMTTKDADLPEDFEPISEFEQYAEVSKELQELFEVPEDQLGIRDGYLVVEVAKEPFCIYLHAPIDPEGGIDWADSRLDIPTVEEKITAILEGREEENEEEKETEEEEIGEEAESDETEAEETTEGE